MKQTIAILGIAGALLASSVYVTVSAQAQPQAPLSAPAAPAAGAAAGRSVTQGVYTAAQAKRGEATYRESCAACHGDDLKGSGPMPPLAGDEFLSGWKGKTLGELFEKTHDTMPAGAPGTLTEQQTADIIAYMLSVAKYPEGIAELEATKAPLAQITIEPAAK